MKAVSSIITILIVGVLLVAGIFLGSITGQAIRGETKDFSSVEIMIVFAAILLCAELAIISFKKKRKEVDIKEMVKQARQEM